MNDNFIKDLLRMTELEKEMNTKVENILDNDFDILFDNASCITFKYKDSDVVITVYLENLRSDALHLKYHINDLYIWEYINRRFFSEQKSINFETKDEDGYIPLILNDDSHKKIQEIYNNKEYLKLREKYNGDK